MQSLSWKTIWLCHSLINNLTSPWLPTSCQLFHWLLWESDRKVMWLQDVGMVKSMRSSHTITTACSELLQVQTVAEGMITKRGLPESHSASFLFPRLCSPVMSLHLHSNYYKWPVNTVPISTALQRFSSLKFHFKLVVGQEVLKRPKTLIQNYDIWGILYLKSFYTPCPQSLYVVLRDLLLFFSQILIIFF